MKHAVDDYLKEGDMSHLQTVFATNHMVLAELFRSTDMTVESLLNSRVCRNLTYVKNFCHDYCEQMA